VAGGVVSGVVYGTLQGIANGSVAAGFVRGMIFGIPMTAISYAGARATAHLGGLDNRQRRMVMRAVRDGDRVDDPALAQATIRHAQQVRARASPQARRTALVILWSLLGASLVGLGVSLVIGSVSGAVAGAFSSVVWVVILLIGPPLEKRSLNNAEAAEAAARGQAPPSPWSRST
jgi:hypothetical protein